MPTQWQKEYPTAGAADKQKDLGKITAKLLLINSQEDFWNPVELGMAEQEIKKVKHGRFVQLPFGDLNRGHYTFFQAAFWQQHLAEFLEELTR